MSEEKELPSDLLLVLGVCDVDDFPNIHRLLISCTLPISSAEAERPFSLMKRIKTCIRATMSEAYSSDLAVIAMHYPERFEVDEVCEAFAKAHPRSEDSFRLRCLINTEICSRVRTGHGKLGKSWNLRISFPGLESHGI